MPTVPEVLLQQSGEAPDTSTFEKLMSDEAVQEYIKQYNELAQKCLNGELGKTPQYWMIYMKMIDRIQTLHHSVSANSYDLRRLIWRQSLPFCFATNRVHYSRYGTYYVQSLDHLDSTHPGAKEEVAEMGLSVRRNTLGIGQAVDMAGEQSYMKNAKTAGGITQFASKETTVAKWVMNRPFQARFVESLVEISGLTRTTSSSRKCLRPSQILKSNKMVENITHCLKTQFLNPFNDKIQKGKLYNLVSGCPVNDDIAESLLNLEKSGKDAMKSFEERLTTETPAKLFFDRLKRNKFKSWNDAVKKATIKKNGKLQELVFQRDILGILAASSYKEKSAVDIDAALCYPLAPVSMPLSSTDGTIRKTVKSKLFSVAMSDLRILESQELPGVEKLYTYFLDVAAAVRSIVGKPSTIRALAARILGTIPSRYRNVYMVCDTYLENSIKSNERQARGDGKRYFLCSPDMKLPPDFTEFLRNGQNKEMLFNLIQQSFEESKSTLNSRVIYFSNKRECTMISENQVSIIPELSSNHEEADTKVIALVKSANVDNEDSVMVRSSSGDIDILALFLSHDFGNTVIYVDNGTGKERKILEVTSTKLSTEQRRALLGLHAFSGNGYASAFFRKGKVVAFGEFWRRKENSLMYLAI